MKKALIVSSLVLASTFCYAQANQGGLANGVSTATGELKGVIQPITTFLYVIAAIVGIYGSIRVYSKHQNGDQDTNKAMGQWGFAFVFLIAAGFIIKATFSV